MPVRERVHTSVADPPIAPGSARRILVAFDGTPAAWLALQRAIEIARQQRSLITIVAVVADPSPWAFTGLTSVPFTREMLQRDAERAMLRALAAARDEVPATVSVTTRLLHGRPGRTIADLAACGDYDLVVTGARNGRHRGSVTRAVLRRSPASVLAVRGA